MWGSVAGSNDRHRGTWSRINTGDWIVFAIDGRFRLAARIYERLDSPALADAVWLPDPESGSYRYLSFFDGVLSIDVSPRAMSAALGYGEGYIYRGFLVPSDDAQERLAAEYGSVEAFLGVLATEHAAVEALAGEALSAGYVSDLAGFDTEEAEARLEEALREHMKAAPPETVAARIRRVRRDRRLVQKLKALYSGHANGAASPSSRATGTSTPRPPTSTGSRTASPASTRRTTSSSCARTAIGCSTSAQWRSLG